MIRSDDNNLSTVITNEYDFLANLIHDSSFSKIYSNLVMKILTRPVHLLVCLGNAKITFSLLNS